MQAIEAKPKASELVKKYLESEFSKEEVRIGMRLPTIPDLAKHLDVSSSTVRQVFREYAVKGQLRSIAGKGTFFVDAGARDSRLIRIATDVPLSTAGVWDHLVQMGILQGASTSGENVSLVPISSDDATPADVHDVNALIERLGRRLDDFDGAILLPTVKNRRLGDFLEKAGKPLVEVNVTDHESTVNFVSVNYREWCFNLGRAWHETGRRRILVITSISPSEGQSSSSASVEGLAAGCRAFEDESVHFKVATHSYKDTGALKHFIGKIARDENTRPDAIFCLSDTLTIAALESLREVGLNVPEQVSVVGGTGFDSTLTAWPNITIMRQPITEMGNEGVKMLISRIKNEGRPAPGLVLKAGTAGGATTRQVENKLLFANHS